MHACSSVRREAGHRRVGAHAAGVRAGIAVADALVVLRGAQQQRVVAVAQREQRHLLARRGIPRSPRTAPASPKHSLLHHRVDRGHRPRPRSRPPPRPCRRPARPPSPRSARRGGGRIRAPRRHRRTVPSSAVGMPAASQISLVKLLLPSSRAAAAVGPQQAMPAASIASASPATSGASGPGTTRSIALSGRSATRPAMSVRADRHAFGDRGDARIAGRAPQLRQQRAGGDRPAQRVLPPARSDHQHPHRRSPCFRPRAAVA